MEQIITAADLSTFLFHNGEVECCRFEQCDLSGVDLSAAVFVECVFVSCNLSNINVSRTSFRECRFESCKMMGVRFDECIPFLQAPELVDCDLKLASFVSMKLTSIHFDRCQLHEVDFSQADLSAAIFSHCDLSGAIFESTDLRKADLHTSFGYTIDPERNSIRQLKVSSTDLSGFLNKYNLIII